MNIEEFNNQSIDIESKSIAKSFVANVFSWMTFALVITGITSWWFASSGLIDYIIQGPRILFWLIALAPIGLVMVMGFSFNRLSVAALTAIFIAYSAINGISLSTIFLVYSLSAIAKVFFITAGLFSTMAVIGYTTNTDLTKMGSILMMALIGIIIASMVNFFLHSAMMDYVISCIGVLIFTGLTAYDTQKIKRIGAGVEYGSAEASKLAIMGALSLYLDFINLFLFLLRIFGGRRD
jgi:FtsH-binding integral membrane protein